MSREKQNSGSCENCNSHKEKQIEEIKNVLIHTCKRIRTRDEDLMQDRYAEALYNAGYRKQSEGGWIKDQESKFEHRYHCSVCNFYLIGEPTKYCEDCGAKMKGGAE